MNDPPGPCPDLAFVFRVPRRKHLADRATVPGVMTQTPSFPPWLPHHVGRFAVQSGIDLAEAPVPRECLHLREVAWSHVDPIFGHDEFPRP